LKERLEIENAVTEAVERTNKAAETVDNETVIEAQKKALANKLLALKMLETGNRVAAKGARDNALAAAEAAEAEVRRIQLLEEHKQKAKESREEIEKALTQEIEKIQRRAILEGKSIDDLDVQKQKLDAQVTAYENILSATRDILDNAPEEKQSLETRLELLRREFERQRELVKTDEERKKALQELARLQEELNRKVDEYYQKGKDYLEQYERSATMANFYEELKKAGTETGEQRITYEKAAYNQIMNYRIGLAKKTLDEEMKIAQEAAEKARKNNDRAAEDRALQTIETLQKAYNPRLFDAFKNSFNDMIGEISGPGVKGKLEWLYGALKSDLDKMRDEEIEKEKWRFDFMIEQTEGGSNERIALEQSMQESLDQIRTTYARRERELNEAKNQAILQSTLDMWQKILSAAQEYLNAASSIANSISTIWTNNIDYETNEKLKANDALIQSDEERAAAEKKIQIEAAQERYKADLFAWSANATMAAAQAAMAVLNALSQPPGPPITIPMSVLAGAMGAMQVAAVISARPKPPRFHSGGVVEGRGEQRAVLMGGEVVQTQRQFQNTMQAISNLAGNKTGGGGVQMNVTVENNASNQVSATPQMTPDGLKIVVEQIVQESMSSGRMDRALAQQQTNQRGVSLL